MGKGFIENKQSQYTMLSTTIKYARIDKYINWNDVEDRTRVYHDLTGWFDSDIFIDVSLDHFLEGYRRDLMKTQDKYLEIWIEKDALSSLFTKVARHFTVPVVVCKGFASVSFLHSFKKRLENKKGKKAIMLYFGDFDPSGKEMLRSMKKTLIGEMEIKDIKFKRIALKQEDIEKYKLPHTPDALKCKDTRAKKHIEKYGELAVELDALRPDILESITEEAIKTEIDMNKFNNEVSKQKVELNKLNQLKERVKNEIQNAG